MARNDPEHLRAATLRLYEPEDLEGLKRTTTKAGYVMVRLRAGVWECEHRLVMAQKAGRPLRKGEVVHHSNGNTSDNRPENLELWSPARAGAHRPGVRLAKCPHCGGVLDQTA